MGQSYEYLWAQTPKPKTFYKKQFSKIIFILRAYSAGQTVQFILRIFKKSHKGLK